MLQHESNILIEWNEHNTYVIESFCPYHPFSVTVNSLVQRTFLPRVRIFPWNPVYCDLHESGLFWEETNKLLWWEESGIYYEIGYDNRCQVAHSAINRLTVCSCKTISTTLTNVSAGFVLCITVIVSFLYADVYVDWTLREAEYLIRSAYTTSTWIISWYQLKWFAFLLLFRVWHSCMCVQCMWAVYD